MKMVKRTDVGKVREHNEDSLELFPLSGDLVLAVVADGLGGHSAGEVASAEAVKMFEKELGKLSPKLSIKERGEQLAMIIGQANEKVYRLAHDKNKLTGMGTTVVSILADEEQFVVAHVGDSRAYFLHRDGLYQMTEDHTFVNFLIKNGQLTEEEAYTHPKRSVLTRAVGTTEEVDVDISDNPWRRDELLLLCSDGLTSMISDREIGMVLSSESMNLEEKADQLIKLALDAGGTDNISLILLQNTD
jgi:PPM family protein phosphatase